MESRGGQKPSCSSVLVAMSGSTPATPDTDLVEEPPDEDHCRDDHGHGGWQGIIARVFAGWIVERARACWYHNRGCRVW
jgi:hypothetical protein